MNLERRFGRSDGALVALVRQCNRSYDVSVILEQRFGRSAGALVALERRSGTLERRFGRLGMAWLPWLGHFVGPGLPKALGHPSEELNLREFACHTAVILAQPWGNPGPSGVK